jgi:hypothetical protein
MSSENKQLSPGTGQDEFVARCHCGQVRGRFVCDRNVIIALACNCSDCFMRRNDHLILPANDFVLDLPSATLDDVTTLYQWGTKTAIRRFCNTCGILPWYHPRSNPDGIAITIYCVDWTQGGTKEAPKIEFEYFDGVHWEESFADHNREGKERKISDLSKR